MKPSDPASKMRFLGHGNHVPLRCRSDHHNGLPMTPGPSVKVKLCGNHGVTLSSHQQQPMRMSSRTSAVMGDLMSIGRPLLALFRDR